ncbi:hypothetical protein [Limnohabitans sp.]|uniref:hypothetical protein n=1 Tax=Limnohabitans sp. TaxID=1907725 RepID=UPI0038BB476A
MNKSPFILAAVLSLFGCTTSKPDVPAASATAVIIRSAASDKEIENELAFAESECKKSGKSAIAISVSSTNKIKYIFECVK